MSYEISRFTTESLSFVLRKLKGSEIEKYIEIVMRPLLTAEDQSNEDLLVNHIGKLLFYAIKSQKETYTSKSLGVIENILKFVFRNNLNEPVKKCILQFIREILLHSRPNEDKFADEFQEKINISKSNLFEHFAKVYIQWLGNLENVKDNVLKIQLMCHICAQMLIYRKGNYLYIMFPYI